MEVGLDIINICIYYFLQDYVHFKADLDLHN